MYRAAGFQEIDYQKAYEDSAPEYATEQAERQGGVVIRGGSKRNKAQHKRDETTGYKQNGIATALVFGGFLKCRRLRRRDDRRFEFSSATLAHVGRRKANQAAFFASSTLLQVDMTLG